MNGVAGHRLIWLNWIPNSLAVDALENQMRSRTLSDLLATWNALVQYSYLENQMGSSPLYDLCKQSLFFIEIHHYKPDGKQDPLRFAQ